MKAELLPLTYIKSKKAGLWHVESSADAKESGVHICSVTNEDIAKEIVDAINYGNVINKIYALDVLADEFSPNPIPDSWRKIVAAMDKYEKLNRISIIVQLDCKKSEDNSTPKDSDLGF